MSDQRPTDPQRHGPPETVRMTLDVLPRMPGYDILEEVGRGGMGVVYRARDLAQDRVVALKVIRVERRDDGEIVGRFRREFDAASRLSHPNVVSVYGYSQVGDTHFLAMEFVPGVTLQKLVEERGAMEIALACELVRQAALGLQHVCDMALVHRDIKPGNLMVLLPATGSNPRPQVKILDMGVARLYQLREHHGESLTTLTRDGVVLGTPDYIAPEQLEDPHGIDVRADLYSLGCVFYFLLAGKVPFPGSNLIQKLDKHRWHHPLSVEQVRPDVPRPVAAVVRRLMAKHPDDRYATPGELAASLDQLQQTGELPTAHRQEPLQLTQTFAGHGKPVVACAFVGAGDQVVSAGGERLVLRWDAATGRVLQRLTEASAEITALATVPGGDQLLVGQGVSVRLYDAASGKEVRRLMGHSDAVRSIAVSRDGRLALTGGDDRTLRLWEVASGREFRRMIGHKGRIGGVALSPDGKLGASGDRDQSLRLWDVLSGRELRTFAVPKGAVHAVAWSPDGRTIATAHYDTTVRLWEVDTGRELRRFTGHKRIATCVAFAADGKSIVSGGNDQQVIVWDVSSGAELATGTGHADAVTAVAFGPDGRHVASASADRTVRLWRLP